MNPKFKNPVYWAITIWFLIFGLLSLIIISTPPIPPINYLILFLGISMMFYCANYEEKLFPELQPEEEEKEE